MTIKTQAEYTARLLHLGEVKEHLRHQWFAETDAIMGNESSSEETKMAALAASFDSFKKKDEENWQSTLELLATWPQEDENGRDNDVSVEE